MNAKLPRTQKATLDAKFKRRLQGLLKADVFELCKRKGYFLPGTKSRCPMSRDILIKVVAQTTWCAKRTEIEDPEKPKGVRKAQLWLELQRLLKLKCAGTAWPETVLDRGITNLEILKYIQALHPSHHYFGKRSQEDSDNTYDDLDSSFDSVFEEQFAEAVKDLPTKLAAKIPKLQRRDDSDDYTDDERPESDGEDPPQVDQVKNGHSPSKRERQLLEKIDYLTQKLEEATRGGARTTRNSSTRPRSQSPMRSSLRATPQPSQDVESVQRYMDCVDVHDDDEVIMATAAQSKPNKKSAERARKSASEFSFNTVHSPSETAPKTRRSYRRGQNLFA